MKALVIGVVLVFLGGCASHVSPGGKAIESPIKEYFGQDPIERRAFGESENGAEAKGRQGFDDGVLQLLQLARATPPCYRAIPAPGATPWPAPSGGSASLPDSSASPGRSPTVITNAGMAGAFRKALRASGFPWRRGSSPWPTATMN